MGISLKKLESMFETAMKEFKEDKNGGILNERFAEVRHQYNIENEIREDIDVYSFGYWVDLVEKSVNTGTDLNRLRWDRFNFLKSEMFNYHSDTYGFPGYYLDFRYLLRIILEYKQDVSVITLDYTELVSNEYENAESMLCKEAADSSVQDYSLSEKIVVLTEGTTDIFFFKNSLRLLYPHVFNNFAFADFSEVRAQGGTSSLISSIKTIISMSIKSRVLAIFDADAAALDALRGLQEVSMPDNIKIMLLPAIDRAKSYPTIGPSGMSFIDINGLACSTEIYLPKEAIKNHAGDFYPIHWRGFIPGVQKYQGEITNKREVFKSFADIVKKIDNGEKSINDFDWTEIHAVFKAIFKTLADN